jgi:hypothetical protein
MSGSPLANRRYVRSPPPQAVQALRRAPIRQKADGGRFRTGKQPVGSRPNSDIKSDHRSWMREVLSSGASRTNTSRTGPNYPVFERSNGTELYLDLFASGSAANLASRTATSARRGLSDCLLKFIASLPDLHVRTDAAKLASAVFSSEDPISLRR